MTTARKQGSNARNSKSSTGPRTAEGKARSSLNAIKHGLTSRQNLIDGETEEAFAEFGDGMLEALKPVGTLEEDCAARLIKDAWRLARCARIETGIFIDHARSRVESLVPVRPLQRSRLSYILSRDYVPGQDPDEDINIPTPSEREIEEAPYRELAEIFRGSAGESLRNLDRHEGAIYRRYQATLHDLMWLQKKRLG